MHASLLRQPYDMCVLHVCRHTEISCLTTLITKYSTCTLNLTTLFAWLRLNPTTLPTPPPSPLPSHCERCTIDPNSSFSYHCHTYYISSLNGHQGSHVIDKWEVSVSILFYTIFKTSSEKFAASTKASLQSTKRIDVWRAALICIAFIIVRM